MQELMLAALLVLTVAWLVVRIRRNKAQELAEKNPHLNNTGAFHAVAIKYSESACAAAKEMTGRRFLSKDAPRLPLPECDMAECRCSFAHYDDRRTGRERRSPFAQRGISGATGAYEKERRGRNDRRSDADEYEF